MNAHQIVDAPSGPDPQPSSNARMVEQGTSESSRIIDKGNHVESLWVNEIATN